MCENIVCPGIVGIDNSTYVYQTNTLCRLIDVGTALDPCRTGSCFYRDGTCASFYNVSNGAVTCQQVALGYWRDDISCPVQVVSNASLLVINVTTTVTGSLRVATDAQVLVLASLNVTNNLILESNAVLNMSSSTVAVQGNLVLSSATTLVLSTGMTFAAPLQVRGCADFGENTTLIISAPSTTTTTATNYTLATFSQGACKENETYVSSVQVRTTSSTIVATLIPRPTQLIVAFHIVRNTSDASDADGVEPWSWQWWALGGAIGGLLLLVGASVVMARLIPPLRRRVFPHADRERHRMSFDATAVAAGTTRRQGESFRMKPLSSGTFLPPPSPPSPPPPSPSPSPSRPPVDS